eukprot:CAMPEP_0197582362 /NCGR_PEP_ID=MMETSP1326-20131121/5589_1 /TAXON_ID=1155430 /ORGANISM="Genus nov. species nov., Strain RCC2288" /LENGTH=420 /DNA_ID=CAMNT_0043146429 /DNA_START=28 /DNA_END=1290 /DNA_ORIENTATION=-
MASYLAASAIGANVGVAFQRNTSVAKRSSSAKQSATRGVVVRAQKSDDASSTAADAAVVSRRQALYVAGVFAGSLASAAPALAGFLDDLELPKLPAGGAVKEKRVINLPPMIVTPVPREEGFPLANGGDKGRAQQQYLKFIEPIIVANADLPFEDYMRLALHDAGTFNVVGKTNGANGSIRFELDRPENKDCIAAFKSVEKIKAAIDAKVTQPISYADAIAIIPHYAARIVFAREYFEVMGPDDPNFEFLFIGTNPYLGAKIRIGRKDTDAADPAGLIPGEDATCDQLVAWFKRMGLGPNQLSMFAPYLYAGNPQKGLDIVSQDGTNAGVLEQYVMQRKLGKRAPGPAVTIIKKLKDVTDLCIPGGALTSVNPAQRDPPYVEYAYIRGGGEIPRVTTFGAYPGSSDRGSSKFAQKVRGDR